MPCIFPYAINICMRCGTDTPERSDSHNTNNPVRQVSADPHTRKRFYEYCIPCRTSQAWNLPCHQMYPQIQKRRFLLFFGILLTNGSRPSKRSETPRYSPHLRYRRRRYHTLHCGGIYPGRIPGPDDGPSRNHFTGTDIKDRL